MRSEQATKGGQGRDTLEERFAQGALEPQGIRGRGEVEQGAGSGRHRNAVLRRDFIGRELAAMDVDPRSLAASACRYVGAAAFIGDEAVQDCGRIVAENRAFTAGEDRRRSGGPRNCLRSACRS